VESVADRHSSAAAANFFALPGSRFCHTRKVMEVQLTPEQEAQLAQIATKAGTDPERLAKDAVLRLLAGDAGFRPVSPGGVVAQMRAIRARVKPDPEGWTTRDYINYGRPSAPRISPVPRGRGDFL